MLQLQLALVFIPCYMCTGTGGGGNTYSYNHRKPPMRPVTLRKLTRCPAALCRWVAHAAGLTCDLRTAYRLGRKYMACHPATGWGSPLLRI